MTMKCPFCKAPMETTLREVQVESLVCTTIYHCDQCHIGVQTTWFAYELDEEEHDYDEECEEEESE